MSLVSLTPRSLPELTWALSHVDHRASFFSRELCVLSECLKEETPQEVVIARTMGLFLKFRANSSSDELREFSEAYSSYCKRTQGRGVSANANYLMLCGEKLIGKILKKGVADSKGKLLLVTDIDGYLGATGAMVQRAMRALLSGFPVVMQRPLLHNMIFAACRPYQDFENSDYHHFKTARELSLELSQEDKWKIYAHTSCDLTIIVPASSSEEVFNLTHYQQITYEEVVQEANLRNVHPFRSTMYSAQDLVQTLSTETDKHIVWAGHGSMDKETLGLPLSDVIKILDQTSHVACWDLHSCYLLSRIREILSRLQNRDSCMVLNNGVVYPSHPLEEDECISAFFATPLPADLKQITSVEKYFSRVSPWIGGMAIVNHPHLIPVGSRQVTSLTFPEISTTIISGEEEIPPGVQRIYVSSAHVTSPLHLPEKAVLLPGLAELNTQHLFEEIITPLSFSDFIASSSSYPCHRPGTRKSKSLPYYHSGGFLFMIKKLHCSDGVYERVILFRAEEGSPPEIHHAPFSSPIEEILARAVSLSRLSSIPDGFDDAIRAAFGVGNECSLELQGPMSSQPIPTTKRHGPYTISSNISYSCGEEMLQAIATQDLDKIRVLLTDASTFQIKEALCFCVEADFFEAFRFIFESVYFIPDEIIARCIEMNRTKMLQALTQKGLTFDECWGLRMAVIYGDIALFEEIKAHSSVLVDVQTLIELAQEVNNWEVVQYLSSLVMN